MRPSVNLTELSRIILGINLTSTTNSTSNIGNNTTSENNADYLSSNFTSNGTRRLDTTNSETLD